MSATSHSSTKKAASKIRVGVVRGGVSGEYPVSLKTGGAVIANLSHSAYRVHDILITKNGKWHFDGIEKKPEDILKHVDVIFNALHGEFGEDGKIQQFLDAHGAKYTGSGALASALAMNKVLTKKHAVGEKIKTAVYKVLRKEELLAEVAAAKVVDGVVDYAEHFGKAVARRAVHLFKTFPHPAVVKPATSGSSLGVSIAHTLHELEAAIHEAFTHSDTILLEEFISGKEATCGVLDHFRGEKHYTLPPVEIRKGGSSSKSALFDFNAKYGGENSGTEEICPGNFTATERDEIQRIAREIHRTLGLKHYSRSDFIVHPRRGVYFLEVNTLPGLTEHSLLPKAIAAVGATFPELLEHLIGLALEGKGK